MIVKVKSNASLYYALGIINHNTTEHLNCYVMHRLQNHKSGGQIEVKVQAEI